LFVFFDLYCVYVCIFVIYIEFFPYCLFVSNSQVIGCEDRIRNDLYCACGVLNSTQCNAAKGQYYCLLQGSQTHFGIQATLQDITQLVGRIVFLETTECSNY